MKLSTLFSFVKENKFILLIILLVLYFLWVEKRLKKREGYGELTAEQWNAIEKLSVLATKMTDGGLVVPGDLTITGKLLALTNIDCVGAITGGTVTSYLGVTGGYLESKSGQVKMKNWALATSGPYDVDSEKDGIMTLHYQPPDENAGYGPNIGFWVQDGKHGDARRKHAPHPQLNKHYSLSYAMGVPCGRDQDSETLATSGNPNTFLINYDDSAWVAT